jgi:hypothetical protein
MSRIEIKSCNDKISFIRQGTEREREREREQNKILNRTQLNNYVMDPIDE